MRLAMIRARSRQAEIQDETAIVCDRCGKEMTPDDLEWHGALRIRIVGGYSSKCR